MSTRTFLKQIMHLSQAIGQVVSLTMVMTVVQLFWSLCVERIAGQCALLLLLPGLCDTQHLADVVL